MFLRGLFLCAFKNKLKQTFSKTTRFRTAMLPSSNVQRNNAVSFCLQDYFVSLFLQFGVFIRKDTRDTRAPPTTNFFFNILFSLFTF